MVQTLSPPSISLELVPLRVPDISLAGGIALSAATDDVATVVPDEVSLLLKPGEISELLLRLTNPTERSLVSTAALSGSLPEAWLITPLERYTLPPLSYLEIAIAFQVPEDFFETLTEAAPGSRRPLNYSGRIDVYSYTLGEIASAEAAEQETGSEETASEETASEEGFAEETASEETTSEEGFAEESLVEEDLFEESLSEDRLVSVSSERFTVALRPESHYLQLLPQIYQEIDFAGRMMAIVERTLTPDVEAWGSLWAYLDPLLAPEAMLPFLAHWVGWKGLPQLNWDQQRRLIHRAIELYTWRGTVYGLRLYLHLVTGLPLDDDDTPALQRHISVVEPSRRGAVFGDSAFSDKTVFGGGQGFHFVVILRLPTGVEVDESLIRAIIDQERPAFCTYELYILDML